MDAILWRVHFFCGDTANLPKIKTGHSARVWHSWFVTSNKIKQAFTPSFTNAATDSFPFSSFRVPSRIIKPMAPNCLAVRPYAWLGIFYAWEVGRITISLTSNSAGCSIAYAMARAIVSGGNANLSRDSSSRPSPPNQIRHACREVRRWRCRWAVYHVILNVSMTFGGLITILIII